MTAAAPRADRVRHLRVAASGTQGALGRFSIPDRLLLASAIGFAGGIVLVLEFWKPGRGIGNVFYLPIILAAMASGPRGGAAAGLLASAAFWSALIFGLDRPWSVVFSIGGGMRLLNFVLAGAVVGYFASRTRRMMGESLSVLDELLLLARRDLVTGAASADGLAGAIDGRLAARKPFALLVGDAADLLGGRNGLAQETLLRDLAARLGDNLPPDGELARIGRSGFAAAVACTNAADAREQSEELERLLHAEGFRMSFGWAVHPSDGSDPLALLRAADERLYARKTVRGEWTPTPTSAGLVHELRAHRKASART